MSVDITKTGGCHAEITWTPQDDPTGRLAQSVERDELAYALELLAGGPQDYDDDHALQAVRHTTKLARLLATAAAVQVVQLRDERGMSWRQIAATVHGDADMQSKVRRQYEAGRRQIGI